MANQILGILTVVICLAGYFYSWKYQAKENYRIAVLLLLICGLLLRIFVSADFFLHAWDERYHALVAKNLISHPLTPTLYDNPVLPYDFKSWVGSHVWLHKQPLPLLTMSLSMWLFGVNEIALRLPSILLSGIGIWLTFFIGSFFFNKKIGYLSALLFSINGLIIELTGGRVATDHIDIFFLFFIQAAIFLSIVYAQKEKMIYNVLAGMSMGAAILCKWLPALIVIPIWFLILIDTDRLKVKSIILQLIVLLVSCVVVFLPWQLYIYKTFPLEANWEAGFNVKHITQVLEGRTGPFYYFIDKIRINYGELIYVPLLWFLWKAFKDLKDYKRLALCIWFLIPFLFFSMAQTKMQAYILFTSPALFMMTSEFWYMLYERRKNNSKYKWVINLTLFLLIALPVRYCIERIKPFEKMDRNPAWVSDLKKINDKKYSNAVMFNYDKPIEAMFYTNLTVYQNIPDKKIIIQLLQKGFTVIINDDGNIPENIFLVKGLVLEHLIIPNKL
ncbi:MAG: glycosyltransferase family 39 protein [Bacteroidia bacterium]|nr:glycosyltransferase family 39 protein [Bacteroidia bacterium]